MISTPDHLRMLVALVTLIAAQGCGLERPPDPPPFDCATIDRAEERFPDECGEPVDADDSAEDGGTTP
jgi:hypothetical protein